MNVLLKSKAELEKFFGKKSTMTPNLLGMNLQGEKAYRFSAAGMNQGYEITVGFFNDKARYAAFKRKSSGPWSEADTRATLMQIGPWEFWASKPGSDFFDYLEKEADKVTGSATGWHTPKKKYSFVYLPVVAGETAIAPDKSAVDSKMT